MTYGGQNSCCNNDHNVLQWLCPTRTPTNPTQPSTTMQTTTNETTTITTIKVMNLGKALKVMRSSGVPTTLAKRRKQKTMTDFSGIIITLDQHLQAYAHGAIEMKVEVRQAIFAFLEAKAVIAKANLDNAKSKRGIRKYTKRLERYRNLANLLAL